MANQLCKCGCGKEVRLGKLYLCGHNKRGMPSTFLGRHHTEEAKRKLSEFNKGKPNAKLGTHLSDETKAKLSQIATAQWIKARENSIPIGFTGHHLTEENKDKLRRCHLGKHLSDETRAKLSKAHKGLQLGKQHTEETKRKIGAYFIGKHLSEEHKLNISRANKGRKLTEEQRIKLSKINTGRHLSFDLIPILSLVSPLGYIPVLSMELGIPLVLAR